MCRGRTTVRRIVFNVLLSCWLCLGIAVVDGDLFTSVARMEELLEMDSAGLEVIQADMDILEKRGRRPDDDGENTIRRMYEWFTQNNTNVRHPIDAYHLLKRWYQMGETYGAFRLVNTFRNLHEVPDASDLQGAAIGILRLQRTYNLTTADLANGNLSGHMSAQPLDALDCYRLGESVMLEEKDKDFGLAAQWLELAVIKGQEILYKLEEEKKSREHKEQEKYAGKKNKGEDSKLKKQKEHQNNTNNANNTDKEDKEDDGKDEEEYEPPEGIEGFLKEIAVPALPFNMSNAYVLLAQAHTMIGDHASALKAVTVARDLDPNNSTIKELYSTSSKMANTTGPSQVNMTTWKRSRANLDYERLCRGELVHKVPRVRAPLTCRYKISRLLPYVQYKEETLSWDPRISMFHDVITEPEMEMIKKTAAPILNRALVTGKVEEVSRRRIGKVAWLYDYDNTSHKEGRFIRGLSERVGDITGMHIKPKDVASEAETFQIVNYGIGGQYEPHNDIIDNEKPRHILFGSGKRMVTFMFYLSDVTEGGATVFPNIGIRIPATKGAAAFWYNVHPNLKKDVDTLHAGCPVLLGEKWVANKWIRSNAQMFHFPCPTNPDAVWT